MRARAAAAGSGGERVHAWEGGRHGGQVAGDGHAGVVLWARADSASSVRQAAQRGAHPREGEAEAARAGKAGGGVGEAHVHPVAAHRRAPQLVAAGSGGREARGELMSYAVPLLLRAAPWPSCRAAFGVCCVWRAGAPGAHVRGPRRRRRCQVLRLLMMEPHLSPASRRREHRQGRGRVWAQQGAAVQLEPPTQAVRPAAGTEAPRHEAPPTHR